MLEILQFPFMQRAFIAGAVLAVILGWIGVYVISRQMSFVGDGVAHASLAAVAFALLVGWSPLPVALLCGVLFAIVLYYVEQHTDVSRDTAIGIFFAGGMALGILLLQFHDGYVPELLSFLFGNILAVGGSDLWTVVIMGAILIGLLAYYHKEFTFVTVDPDGAELAGIPRASIELLLYIMMAISVVLSIKLVGIVLVSALLVLPSAISKAMVSTFSGFQLVSVLLSFFIVMSGLVISYYADLPSGASIVLTGIVLFVLVHGVQWVRER